MKPSFRQHLLKWRTLFGAVTLLCLLWHILLPTMVHTGIAPTLYAMPTHCQVTEIKNSMTMSHAHMSHHQHDMHQQHLQDSKTTQLSAHELEVFALAAQIMKHCPLCSYGLDDAAIIPLLACIFIVLLAWFGRVRCLCASWKDELYLPRIFYILPIKQAPPLAL